MYKYSIIPFIFVILFSLIFSTSAEAKNYKASLALLPVAAETKEKGILVDLVRLWGKVTENKIEIKVYPFKRSLKTVIEYHEADFHLPLIKNPHKHDNELDFDYSTSVIFNVNFVLYTNKDKPIDRNKLSEYKITTDGAHTHLFDFKIGADFKIESSLKKLSAGRIDGYIFADVEADPVLKKLGLKNIKRELYKIYDVHAVLPKGEKGKEADIMITEAMNKIRNSGEWAELMNPVYHEYINWQP